MSQSPSIAEVALSLQRYPGRGIVTPTEWTALPLIAPWVATPGGTAPAYRVDAQGNVSLRGNVTGGATNSQVGQLPAVLAPLVHVGFMVPATGPGPVSTAGQVNIDPTWFPVPGGVICGNLLVPGNPLDLYLDGVQFNIF